jgi:hypothetical protein
MQSFSRTSRLSTIEKTGIVCHAKEASCKGVGSRRLVQVQNGWLHKKCDFDSDGWIEISGI